MCWCASLTSCMFMQFLATILQNKRYEVRFQKKKKKKKAIEQVSVRQNFLQQCLKVQLQRAFYFISF